MTDLISREAAIALLESIRKRREGDFPYEQFAMEQAIEALTNMPSAEIPIRFDEWDAIP